MTRSAQFLFALLCLGIPTVSPTAAQQSSVESNPSIPHLIRFSGLLKSSDGSPARGTVGVVFAFYKDEQGGTPLWMETQNVRPDTSGRYSVMLGSTKSEGLPAELFISNEARWLSVEPQGLPAPARVLLLSVPYALKAADAETIGGLPPSAFVLAPPTTSATPAPATSSTNAPPPASGVTTAGGKVNTVPLWSTATDIENSAISQSGSGNTAKIGINTTTPATTLDVKGGATVRGTLSLPATAVATAAGGKNSQPANLAASSFNSTNSTAITQTFQLKAEPAGNDTTAPSGTLNVLYGAGTSAPTETGLKISSQGLLTFATGQTFPGTGNGTITGVTAGTALSGGGSSGNVTLNVDATKVPLLNAANTFTGNQTVSGTVSATSFSGSGSALTSLQGANVQGTVGTANNALNLGGLPPSSYQAAGSYATLGANTFTGNQNVTGNLTSTGTVSGSIVNGSTYSLGGSITPFLSGSVLSNNAFLGFAGNLTTTGINNIAGGPSALFSNTTGGSNTALGQTALNKNTTGSSNVAAGTGALANNTTGGSNTAFGGVSLTNNITGSYNTGLGYGAGPDVSSPALTNATAVGAFAIVSKSNALALGGTGANAVNVGIGTATPNFTLDVHGTGNFTGPITFASGQTFPGAGTITGVTAGTGLSGGGTSGTVSMSLNTGYSDGRYAQLAANNTFSGVQVINNNVGIGISSPVYSLHTMGGIRSEAGGISLGSGAPVLVDAPFVPGGRLTILSNGLVGINNTNPASTLDVGGSINASGALTTGGGLTVGGPLNSQGSLTIKNDQPMNAAPRLFFSGFFAGNLFQGQNGALLHPSKAILITRMITVGQFAYLCSPPGTISLWNINTGGILSSVSFDQFGPYEYSSDSGPLSIPVAGDTVLLLQVTQQPVCGLFQGPNNVSISVEYVMQ